MKQRRIYSTFEPSLLINVLLITINVCMHIFMYRERKREIYKERESERGNHK